MTISIPDFLDKLREALSIGEVQQAARLATVAISTSNDRTAIRLGEFNDVAVFLPSAKSAEFESVQNRICHGEEIPDGATVFYLPDVRQIPKRMVEDQ